MITLKRSIFVQFAAAACLCLAHAAEAQAPNQIVRQTSERAEAEPEAAGQAAEEAGRFQQAFVSYLSAYQSLPDPPPAADDRRLREKIIRIVARLSAPPAISPTARAHVAKADELLAGEALLGSSSGTSSLAALAELRQAVRSTPWWAEATLKLATVLQRLQRVDEALLNLNLYQLADPVGYLDMRDRAAAKTPSAAAPSAPPAAARSMAPATFYVYWPKQQRGGGTKKVRCDAQNVAELRKNRYVALKAAPGTHAVTFDGKDVIVAAEPGAEYYFRASLEGHTQFSQGPVLRQVTAAVGKAEIKEQKTTINDAKKTFSTQCLAAAPVPIRRGR